MSNQNLVPRSDKSGSIGVPSKKWGSGSFANLDIDNVTISNANLTGSLSGSFDGVGNGTFNGQFSGSASGSFQGAFDGNFTGDGSGLNNITALDTGSLLGIQRIYDTGSQVDDFSTISGALAASVPGDTVFVGAGTYKESDLVVKDGVQLVGKTATDRDVIIDASGSNNFGIKVQNNGEFAFFEIKGADNENPIVIMQSENTTNENPLAAGISIRGGNNINQTGLLITGSGFVVGDEIAFISKGETMGDSIVFEGDPDLTFYGRGLRFSSNARSLIKTTGSGGFMEMSGIEVEGATVDYDYGLDIDSNVSLQVANFNWSSDVSEGVYFNKGSDGCQVELMAGNAEGEVNDVVIHPSASGNGTSVDFSAIKFRGERYLDKTNGVWSKNASVNGIFIDDGLDEDPITNTIGHSGVGSPAFPSDFSAGEGNSSILNMKVLSSGSGGWVDQTNSAASSTGSTFDIFPNDSGSGAAWYVGNTQRKFSGIKSKMIKPQVDGEVAGVWEYSSGSEWVPFYVLSTDGTFPYNQYGQQVFPSASTEDNNIRFNNLLVIEESGSNQEVDWQPSTVQGTDAYWVRYRLTSSLQQSAKLERVKLHTNRSKVNKDGFLEHFGAAEYRGNLQWHKNLEYILSGKQPAPSTIDISPNISLEYSQNTLTNSTIDGSGGIIKIENGLNTSRNIDVDISFIASQNASDSNRQIELEVDTAEIKVGDTLDGTLNENSYSKIIPISQTDGGVLKQVRFQIEVPNLVDKEFFAMSYFRDATNNNPDDNYAGDVQIIAVDVTGYFWNE